jgi:hypothetical protein
MRLWVEALLDPTPIEKGNKDRQNTHIQMPPRFEINKATPAVILPPSSSLRPTRARSTRSASPSKIATPSRKMASPRKSRRTPKPEVAKAEETTETQRVSSATSALQHVLENGTTASESVASESVNGEARPEESVRIEVQETVEQNGEVETTTTNVKIEVPAEHPELPTPEDPQKMIEQAKRMVEVAKKLDGNASQAVKSSKRKADELSKDDEGTEDEPAARPAKHAKIEVEQKLTKEKVTRRALVGLGVMAAIGYVFRDRS